MQTSISGKTLYIERVEITDSGTTTIWLTGGYKLKGVTHIKTKISAKENPATFKMKGFLLPFCS